ncbi:ROK family protein [Zavarzinella formosa]|uniref:ROK family protein n=1 Tax=Zavarzinella formosa TaxID=360055 RepID=UPI0002EF35CE|nr:ROK family protein [Zavarzinella formosa]
MAHDKRWIGVDLGGTKILAGLFDHDLKLIGKVKTSTNFEEGGPAVFARIVQSVDQVMAEAGVTGEQIAGMGLAVPGQIVPQSTIVRYAPNLKWRDFDLKPLFPAHWKWPVIIDNDVRMGTYGEWSQGAAKGAANVFGIFAGTGVGGGLILDNKLFHGFNGHAGEIGHIIINWKRGTELEAIAGRRNLMVRAKELIADAPKNIRKEWKNTDPTTFKSSLIADYVAKQDPIMLQVIDEAARSIGAAVGTVVNLLSPEVIVIGGGVTKALGVQFPERIWEFAQRYALPRSTENVRCVMSALGDDAGIAGSAAFAQRNFAANA